MIRENARAAGICSMVLGMILTTYGGYRVGRRIDWATNYVYGVYSTPYEYVLGESEQPKKQLPPEDKAEIGYITNSLYLFFAGITVLLGGGMVAIATRDRFELSGEPRKYRNLPPPKGTRKNPYSI